MLNADYMVVHTKGGVLHGTFVREYKFGIILETGTGMLMIPWHNIEYTEYDTINKTVSNTINEIMAGKNAA